MADGAKQHAVRRGARGARRRPGPAKALAAAAAAGSSLALASAAFGLPPFTTTPKSAGGSGGQVEGFGLATACHARFDRLVLRGRFGTPEYDARYVRRVRSDGSGRVVRLRGTKRLRVVLRNARAHTDAGAALIPGAQTPLCPNLRQVKLAGDFEGQVTFGLGLRRKTGFRVFRLTNPTRVVIDLHH
jgi:hypothetical protein